MMMMVEVRILCDSITLVMVAVKLMAMMLFVSTAGAPVVITVSGVSPITHPL